MRNQAAKVSEWLSLVAGAIECESSSALKGAAPVLEQALREPGPLPREVVDDLKATARRVLKAHGQARSKAEAVLSEKVSIVVAYINSATVLDDEVSHVGS